MLYLLETASGIALFKNGDELSLVSAFKYPNWDIGCKYIDQMENGDLPVEILDFLKSNISNEDSLNILNPKLIDKISECLKIELKSINDDTFRNLRNNAFKYFDVSNSDFNVNLLKVTRNMVSTSFIYLDIVDALDSVEEMEKSINNRIMRIREWYSNHFPELNTVSDNIKYLNLLIKIGDRSTYTERKDVEIDAQIEYLIANSMGTDLSNEDVSKIILDAKSILEDIEFRNSQLLILKNKCSKGFPNAIKISEPMILSKLLRKAGSIAALSLMPASTIQILGAEKAFNNAIKERTNTPKYGIIYDSGYISKASDENKGKIARILANKLSLCLKVDAGHGCEDGAFGIQCKEKIRLMIERIEDYQRNKKEKKTFAKKIITVKQYDTSNDAKRRKINK